MARKHINSARSKSTTRYWTTHWQYRFWRPDVNSEGVPIKSSGSNSYRKRGIAIGDIVYVVSLADGQLYLGGRMIVGKIVSRMEAVRIRKNPDLYDAEEWIIPKDNTSTLLHLHRRLAPEVSKQLLFVSPRSEPKQLFFEPGTDHIDRQATRGVRELTPESASLLNQIIEITDRSSDSGRLTTVTRELLGRGQARSNPSPGRLTEEVPDGRYDEGEVNRYERDPRARDKCIIFNANIGRAYVELRCLYLNTAAWKTGLIKTGKLKVLLDGEKEFHLDGYLNPRGGLEGMEKLYERLKLKEGMKLRYTIPRKNTILIYGPAYSKHKDATITTADTLTRSQLRRKLQQMLPTISLFDAFCLDYFPIVKRAFSHGMDRTERTNLLLEHTDCEEVGEKLHEFLRSDPLLSNLKPD